MQHDAEIRCRGTQMKRDECLDKCDCVGTRWGRRDRLAALKDTLYELRVADDRLDVCLQVSAIAAVAREAVGILDRATAVPQHRVQVWLTSKIISVLADLTLEIHNDRSQTSGCDGHVRIGRFSTEHAEHPA